MVAVLTSRNSGVEDASGTSTATNSTAQVLRVVTQGEISVLNINNEKAESVEGSCWNE